MLAKSRRAPLSSRPVERRWILLAVQSPNSKPYYNHKSAADDKRRAFVLALLLDNSLIQAFPCLLARTAVKGAASAASPSHGANTTSLFTGST